MPYSCVKEKAPCPLFAFSVFKGCISASLLTPSCPWHVWRLGSCLWQAVELWLACLHHLAQPGSKCNVEASINNLLSEVHMCRSQPWQKPSARLAGCTRPTCCCWRRQASHSSGGMARCGIGGATSRGVCGLMALKNAGMGFFLVQALVEYLPTSSPSSSGYTWPQNPACLDNHVNRSWQSWHA